MRKLVVRKDHLVTLAIILFVVCRCLDHLPLLNYYDEIAGVLASLYIVFFLIRKKLARSDQLIVLCLGSITGIGLISNVFSRLISIPFAIIVDVVWLWKPLAVFLAFKYLALSHNRTDRILQSLYPLAKCGVWVTVILSILSQTVDFGMTGKTVLFGLKQFGLFDHNAIQTGWFLFSCIMIISECCKYRRKVKLYIVLATVPMLLTFSSLVTCWIVCEFALLILLGENRVFKKRYIAVVGAGIGIVCFSGIRDYFLSESIRLTLIQYSIVTANSYFPLGSGFATYGSEMAHRHYSELYIRYGFNHIWGLSQTNDYYMNDNFMATVIGQYGWIGAILYAAIVYLIFNGINSRNLNRYARAAAVATMITMAAAMTATGSPKSMLGTFQFAVLGIMAAKASPKENPDVAQTTYDS